MQILDVHNSNHTWMNSLLLPGMVQLYASCSMYMTWPRCKSLIYLYAKVYKIFISLSAALCHNRCITHLLHHHQRAPVLSGSIELICTVLHRDTIVYRRGHRNLPARPSKMTGAAIETVVYIGHRKWPALPSKPTGAAIETYRRGHRKWPARPSKPTGAAIETYRPVILDGRAGHFRWPRRSF